jgi:hypothetical protein
MDVHSNDENKGDERLNVLAEILRLRDNLTPEWGNQNELTLKATTLLGK